MIVFELFSRHAILRTKCRQKITIRTHVNRLIPCEERQIRDCKIDQCGRKGNKRPKKDKSGDKWPLDCLDHHPFHGGTYRHPNIKVVLVVSWEGGQTNFGGLCCISHYKYYFDSIVKYSLCPNQMKLTFKLQMKETRTPSYQFLQFILIYMFRKKVTVKLYFLCKFILHLQNFVKGSW